MKTLKKLTPILLTLTLTLLAALYFAPRDRGGRVGAGDADGVQLTIVASLFPQYDFARAIAGARADVTLLLPPGTESHTFDPRPADIAAISAADLFIYTGKYMEPWVERIAKGLGRRRVLDGMPERASREENRRGRARALDASEGIALIPEEEHAHETHEAHEAHDHGGFDPHFWLNPLLAVQMVRNIERAIRTTDPANAAFYAKNADDLVAALTALDEDFASAVRRGKRRTLVFGGRFAYRYFTDRYGLLYVTAYHSCSSEAEPSVRDVIRVSDYVRAHHSPCVYHEEFVDPKVARTIARAGGAELRLFSTAHNVTKDELDGGTTFLDIMRRNLENVKFGLGAVDER